MRCSRDTFHLVDLASQAEAVQAHVAGRTLMEKVAWLEARGTLVPFDSKLGGAAQVYSFESRVGIRCGFFIDGDRLVFFGDNTTWSVPRRSDTPHAPRRRRAGAAGILSFALKLLRRGPRR